MFLNEYAEVPKYFPAAVIEDEPEHESSGKAVPAGKIFSYRGENLPSWEMFCRKIAPCAYKGCENSNAVTPGIKEGVFFPAKGWLR